MSSHAGRLTPTVGTFARWPVALAWAIALATGTAAAGPITIDTKRDGDTIAIHANAVLTADAATAWRVLTDYGRYPQFIPDLHVSRVVSRHGATVTVEQSGDAALWLFRMPLDMTFEIRESPPGLVQSQAIAGSLRALTSRYELTPEARGVRLDYAGRITPGYSLFGHLEQAAVEGNIARQFQALADEIERQGAAERSQSRTTGAK